MQLARCGWLFLPGTTADIEAVLLYLLGVWKSPKGKCLSRNVQDKSKICMCSDYKSQNKYSDRLVGEETGSQYI